MLLRESLKEKILDFAHTFCIEHAPRWGSDYVKKCPYCGNKSFNMETVCRYCGTKLPENGGYLRKGDGSQ